ncbi:hypothetical protein DFH06DRAFT_1125995 [Mycena polygramma]|nr:hypothetical protein DFH06DRAFT_1125995 [Mycena polygramma]
MVYASCPAGSDEAGTTSGVKAVEGQGSGVARTWNTLAHTPIVWSAGYATTKSLMRLWLKDGCKEIGDNKYSIDHPPASKPHREKIILLPLQATVTVTVRPLPEKEAMAMSRSAGRCSPPGSYKDGEMQGDFNSIRRDKGAKELLGDRQGAGSQLRVKNIEE